jgi:Flp pilus assembly protein TadG
MNKCWANAAKREVNRHRHARGQSAVELALVTPIMIVLLLVAADFGRVFYTSIAVNNAARAAAQYGSQSVVTAADSVGMAAAAKTDGWTGLNVSATQCTCQTSTSVTQCTTIASTYCTNNPQATYVSVTVQAPFQTLVTYPGLPSSITLTGHAIMQVQQ